MPPRKSNASIAGGTTSADASTPASPTTAAPAAGDTSVLSTTTAGAAGEPKSPTSKKSSRGGGQQNDDLGIDDLLLPRSLTSRIARGMLPPNTSLQKDAVLALTKSATVFISFLAATANEQRPSAKTVTPQDVLRALQEMELEKVMGLGERREDGSVGGKLERELAAFEEVVRGKRKGYRDKVKARESGVSVGGVEGGEGGEDEGERDAKRAKRVSGENGEEGEEEQDDEDALLDAQLNGPNGAADDDLEEDEGDDDDPDDEEPQQDEDEDEIEDSIDVEDELEGGRHSRNGTGSRAGHSSILAPNGRAELGSDDDSE